MKKIILMLIIISSFWLVGCSEKRIILVPQTEYYPTFNISDFNKSIPHSLNIWVETKEVNGTTKNYLVAEKKDMLSCIKDVKVLRSNYNILLNQINKFNIEIQKLNQIQQNKKPTEVESINDSWFK